MGEIADRVLRVVLCAATMAALCGCRRGGDGDGPLRLHDFGTIIEGAVADLSFDLECGPPPAGCRVIKRVSSSCGCLGATVEVLDGDQGPVLRARGAIRIEHVHGRFSESVLAEFEDGSTSVVLRLVGEVREKLVVEGGMLTAHVAADGSFASIARLRFPGGCDGVEVEPRGLAFEAARARRLDGIGEHWELQVEGRADADIARFAVIEVRRSADGAWLGRVPVFVRVERRVSPARIWMPAIGKECEVEVLLLGEQAPGTWSAHDRLRGVEFECAARDGTLRIFGLGPGSRSGATTSIDLYVDDVPVDRLEVVWVEG
jgi:hypothetical protein